MLADSSVIITLSFVISSIALKYCLVGSLIFFNTDFKKCFCALSAFDITRVGVIETMNIRADITSNKTSANIAGAVKIRTFTADNKSVTATAPLTNTFKIAFPTSATYLLSSLLNLVASLFISVSLNTL